MCILFVYTDPKPQENAYRFIIASNRDEFYRRPAHCVSQNQQVIGGRDLEENRSGGMWLGISLRETDEACFRFGALLNITGEKRPESKGRGFIVHNYLDGTAKANDYIAGLLNATEPYSAFNFVAAEINARGEVTVHHCSNVPTAHNVHKHERFLGFGNTSPTAQLTKVKFGLGEFEKVVGRNNDIERGEELVKGLLELLKNENEQLPDEVLEKRQPQYFQQLSCIFVKLFEAGYGTRTHSIILVDYEWNVEFHEVTLDEPIDPEHPVWKTNVVRAKL